ncbi:NOTCH2 [Branchiostoma lanceolatum]|uniref:NOTCH2 protein n=1 Tax=Branchiostoma lanceolatum TaxID=7740 RepID=A0A8J9YLP9_BRALA|nr:NOTCH2 [Branchiostoma lanceolatum]
MIVSDFVGGHSRKKCQNSPVNVRHSWQGSFGILDCPDGYTYGDPYCYKVVIASVNFYDAQAACALDGGRLADPKSLDEHNDIIAVLTAAGSPASAMIGLNDFITEGTFLYMDGSALGGFSPWSAIINRDSKDCVQMDGTDNYNWTPYFCDPVSDGKDLLVSYVCQIDPATWPSEISCPPGFRGTTDTMCYKVITTKMAAMAARAACQSETGVDVAMPKTQQQHDMLKTIVRGYISACIGLSDFELEGNWEYVDHTFLGAFTPWGSVINTDALDCVVMDVEDDYLWNPIGCTDKKFAVCETDPDECLSSPCGANAICTNTIGSFTCACQAGFYGDGFTCQEMCNTGYTMHGGYCYSVSPTPSKAIDALGYCTGQGAIAAEPKSQEEHDGIKVLLTESTWIGIADLDVDGSYEYASDSSALVFVSLAASSGSGECVMMDSTQDYDWVKLSCLDSKPVVCQQDVDECLSSPCDVNADCTNTFGSFTCQCHPGLNGDGFTCHVCSTGYSLYGGYCYKTSSPVDGNALAAMTYCTNEDGIVAEPKSQEEHDYIKSFLSETTWIGIGDLDNDGSYTYVSDDTPVGFSSVADNHGNDPCVAMDSTQGYDWILTSCTSTHPVVCQQDHDECELSPCDVNANCTNTYGSYTCTCRTGFPGDGFSCDAFTIVYLAFRLSNLDYANVTATQSSIDTFKLDFASELLQLFIASIPADRILNVTVIELREGSVTPVVEVDVHRDEEAALIALVESLEGNTVGSDYVDQTATGQKDVDECLSSPCDVNADCTNTFGSFTCQCHLGLSGDGFTCDDQDECQLSPCDVNANCTNTYGSYTCTCRTGFSGDGFNCNDAFTIVNLAFRLSNLDYATVTVTQSSIDTFKLDFASELLQLFEASIPADRIRNVTVTELREGSVTPIVEVDVHRDEEAALIALVESLEGNTVGSDYVDQTATGQKALTVLVSCNDTVVHNCHPNATCISRWDDGWYCACNSGFTGDGTFCEDINECSIGSYSCESGTRCSNTLGSYECAPGCPSGYFNGEGTQCYKAHQEPRSAIHAALVCESDGATLAMPKSQVEHDFLKLLASGFGFGQFWIGITDNGLFETTEGTFTYINGDPLGAFLKWSADPANTGPNDCVYYKANGDGSDLEWNVENCLATNKFYICELPINTCRNNPWHWHNEQYYRAFSTFPATYDEAKDLCEMMDATLAMPFDDGIQESLMLLTNEDTWIALECPTEWKLHEGYNVCYFFEQQDATFNDAIDKCECSGSRLFQPEVEDAHHFVSEFMSNETLESSWLYLSDRETEGVFIWGDGDELEVHEEDWRGGHPNFTNKEDEDCVILSTTDNKLKVHDCLTQKHYACMLGEYHQEKTTSAPTTIPTTLHPTTVDFRSSEKTTHLTTIPTTANPTTQVTTIPTTVKPTTKITTENNTHYHDSNHGKSNHTGHNHPNYGQANNKDYNRENNTANNGQDNSANNSRTNNAYIDGKNYCTNHRQDNFTNYNCHHTKNNKTNYRKIYAAINSSAYDLAHNGENNTANNGQDNSANNSRTNNAYIDGKNYCTNHRQDNFTNYHCHHTKNNKTNYRKIYAAINSSAYNLAHNGENNTPYHDFNHGKSNHTAHNLPNYG